MRNLLKFKIYIVAILAVVFMFAGCSNKNGDSFITVLLDKAFETFHKSDYKSVEVEKQQSVLSKKSKSYNDKEDNIIVVQKVEELKDDEQPSNVNDIDNDSFNQAKEEMLRDDGASYYYYGRLTEEERIVYTELLGILRSCGEDVTVSSIDPKLIDKAFTCVILDHPELFYISGYSFTKYMRGNKIEKITVSGTYTMNREEIEQAVLLINAYTDKCVSEYDGDGDEYSKVKFVYEYLIENTEYDLLAEHNQSLYGIMKYNRTVCQGYAKATQYILNRMGVFCMLCEGTVKGTEAHVWNIVRIDKKYYHVDTTWGDASYTITSENDDVQTPEINYDYLCIDDETIQKTHFVKQFVELPECNSMDSNYYVLEGLYLTQVDTDIIYNAFERARAEGEDTVTLKCSDANVYAALYSYLIESEKVFEYLGGSTTVNFAEFRDSCKIAFYI